MFMLRLTPLTSALAIVRSSSMISTIRPGIPRHMLGLPLVGAWGGFQTRPYDSSLDVLEGAAGERDGGRSSGFPDALAAGDDDLGHRAVEPGRCLSLRSSRQEVLHDPAKDLPGLHDPALVLAPQPEGIAPACRAVRGQLQFHCGLSFVGGPLRSGHPGEGRYGVEEPARAGGRRGVETVLHEPGNEPRVPLAHPAHQRERKLHGLFFAVEREELRERHPPRLPDGRRSTGQRSVFQVSSPREPLLYAPLKEFSAPDGPVGPVAGPVQRHPDDALLARPLVVGQATRDVRVMVLYADGW